MLNLIIADDEELERRAIKNIVLTRFKDTFTIYEAKNGREAIEISDKIKPDVVIMDIKMPGINGMEAIKEMRKFLKDGHFILLTAYDYFNYAKEAIEYGVKEYMLKPFKREELVKKLEFAIEQAEAIRMKRRSEMELREKFYSMRPMIENELCYGIIYNNLHTIEYRTHLDYLEMRLEAGYAIVLRFKELEESKKMNSLEHAELKMKIKEYAEEICKGFSNAIASYRFTEDIVIFIENKEEEYQAYLDSLALGKKIKEGIKVKFKYSISIGIGKSYKGIEKLYLSYKEALCVLQEEEKNMKVVHYEDLDEEKKNPDYYSAEKLKEKTVLEPSGKEGSVDSPKQIIPKAMQYIREKYNEDITLEEVASFVLVSPYYFSKLFKEFTGKNYVDYITEYRVQKAKEMIKKGELSIKEICFEVGYNDPNYFSRVFKKVEGVTPSEYKSRNAI